VCERERERERKREMRERARSYGALLPPGLCPVVSSVVNVDYAQTQLTSETAKGKKPVGKHNRVPITGQIGCNTHF
jgi:hypothetical protein